MPKTDPSERIYAIGDVHGRYDLLRLLLDRIEQHNAERPRVNSVHTVLVGDLIDRGPSSAEVVEFLFNEQRKNDRLIVLMGNHEEAMLRSIDGDPEMLRMWMAVGGKETLESFGAPLPQDGTPLRHYLRKLNLVIPRPLVNWIRKLPLTARSGDYLFCHAGIRPGIALRRQVQSDLLWIREEFLEDKRDHGVVVVHGHSIEPQVEIRHNRIGIDTGAYRTGQLTAVCLEDAYQEVISVQLADGET